MSANMPQSERDYGQIIAKAWADEAFKARLLQDPAAVLSEYGVSIPDGLEIRVVENTDKVTHLVLPAKPQDELSEEQLQQVSGAIPTAPSILSFLTYPPPCQ